MNISTNSLVFIATGRGGKLKKALENTSWTLHYYPLTTLSSKLTRLRRLFHLVKVIVSDPKPGLVMIDVLGIYALILRMTTHLTQVKFAVRLRGDAWFEGREAIAYLKGRSQIRRRFLILIATILVRWSDFAVPVSQFLAELTIQEAKISPDKIIVLPTYVDINRFQTQEADSAAQLKQRSGFSPGDHIILSVTNFKYLAKVQGLKEYVPVFNKLCDRDQSVHWVIAGDGTYYGRLKRELLGKVAYPDNIRFIGRTDEVEKWYQACDFLLHFSLLDAFPNVVMEAAACGKTCLANNLGGMKEIIVNEVTGHVIDPGEVSEVLDVSLKLLYDLEYRELLGKQARARIEQIYTAQAVGKQFELSLLQKI